MGKSKRKKKRPTKSNKVALIVAVILTALVIFFARGGIGATYKLIFKTKASHKTAVISISSMAYSHKQKLI